MGGSFWPCIYMLWPAGVPPLNTRAVRRSVSYIHLHDISPVRKLPVDIATKEAKRVRVTQGPNNDHQTNDTA